MERFLKMHRMEKTLVLMKMFMMKLIVSQTQVEISVQNMQIAFFQICEKLKI